MSAFGRFFARLFRRKPGPAGRSAPFDLAAGGDESPQASTADAQVPDAQGPLQVEPRSELAISPGLGAASGEAQVLAATAGVALVDADAPTADEEDVFEEEERAEDAADEASRGPDLDDKIAARAAAVPYLRQMAEEEALAGKHRVRPTDPSGPGTLAEALARLEAEGRLVCDLGEDAEGAPILVYRPLPSVH